MENRPIEIETGTDPQASVIVLHGLGASGDDFVPVCEQLDLGAVGPVRHVLPHAPMRPVTINNGFVMPAWYDIPSLGGGPAVEDEAGYSPVDGAAAARGRFDTPPERDVDIPARE